MESSIAQQNDRRTPGRKKLLIQCLRLHKRYGRDPEVFCDATFEAFKGDFICIVGPTGSGKTTFLKLLLGLEPLDDGQILIEEESPHQLSAHRVAALRRRFGVVAPFFGLLPERTVFENVSLPLRVAGKRRLFIDEKVRRTLRFAQLQGVSDLACHRISKGVQRRVAIARALCGDPLVILADDPAADLDTCASQEVVELFEKIRMRGVTVLYTTRSDAPPFEFSQARVLRIGEGKIFEEPPSVRLMTSEPGK